MPLPSKEHLESLYERYNRPEFIHPDPLEFLAGYNALRDREIAGLIAASLAYGRVAQILKSVKTVLDRLGPCPADFLAQISHDALESCFSDFRHRFADGRQLAFLLSGIKDATAEYGSLYDCFLNGFRTDHDTVLPAMIRFCNILVRPGNPGHLVPLPERGSACKRLNLFLRWMVRKDAVDPGGWDAVPASRLIVPLDVHMHRVCMEMGLTRRKQANMRTALEVTAGFAVYSPEDPVRYDFALTRPGIRGEKPVPE